jgi:hypothetical protein
MHWFRAGLLALFPALLSAQQSEELIHPLAIQASNGFCANGAYGGMSWPAGVAAWNVSVFGSFCSKQNGDTGRFESVPFLAPPAIRMWIAGYPGLPGRRLLLKNLETGAESEFKPTGVPGELWRSEPAPMPPDWVGHKIQIVAIDEATGALGWLAFGLPDLPPSAYADSRIDTRGQQAEFCSGGTAPGTQWTLRKTWGTWCKQKDADTGWFATPARAAARVMRFAVAGYAGTAGMRVALENPRTGEQLPVPLPDAPGQRWRVLRMRLPDAWQGEQVRLIARDDVSTAPGWLAVTELSLPATAVAAWEKFAWYAWLMMAPAAALVLITRFRKLVAAAALLGLPVLAIVLRPMLWTAPLTVPAALAGVAIAVFVFSFLNWRRNPRKVTALLGVWLAAFLAILPVVLRMPASRPYPQGQHDALVWCGYLAAAGICYAIYQVERPRLERRLGIALVFLILLLTCVVNNVHQANVDDSNNYIASGNTQWQENMQQRIMLLDLGTIPHAYRFLPNSIVRWMEIAGLDYPSARGLYRLLAGLLLFYALYRYARLYTGFTGAILAMVLSAAIFPVSFQHYAGQLTDPLSHLSFVLALIFLETGDFAWLLTTLLIGSLAKETVLAMAGYYVLFGRHDRSYPAKAVTLAGSSLAVYFGVRMWVLGRVMDYKSASDVTPEHIAENWRMPTWPPVFLLTACALLPFLFFGWKETSVSLKRQVFFLFPVLVVSSLIFSWLAESRNFMPLVFVLSVVAGGYLSRSMGAPQATEERAAVVTARSNR